MKNNIRIKTFICNWSNYEKNALNLQSQLNKISDVTVISGTDNSYDHENWIEIGADAYYTAQWNRVLDLFDPTKYDFLLQIQADATTDQAEEIAMRALELHSTTNFGIYAPNVHYSAWGEQNINKRDFLGLKNVHAVSGTDCTFWFLHKDVIVRGPHQFDISRNTFGFGIDLLYNKICHLALGRPLLKDYNFLVDHPKFTGYSAPDAMKQCRQTKEEYAKFVTDEIKWI